MPTRWMLVKDDIRMSFMRRFPYVIYYRVVESGILRVIAVKHQRRRPEYGRNRS